MPPRLPAQLRPHGCQGAIFKVYVRPKRYSAGFFCSPSLDSNQEGIARCPERRAPQIRSRRFKTTAAAAAKTAAEATPAATVASIDTNINPRKELEIILRSLQKHAANQVNLPRLQLAINGLQQRPGDESVRIAILSLTDEPTTAKTTKEVLQLLLSDPLKDPEAWEREVEQHDLAAPLIIRIGAESRRSEPSISLPKGDLLPEVHITSAAFNSSSLEILLASTAPYLSASEDGARDGLEDKILAPIIDIPTSNAGRHTSIATPVHKVLIVADGIRGAASVMSMPKFENDSLLNYAVNIPEYKPTDQCSLPFVPIDTDVAKNGLGLVRKDIGSAMEYEHLWFQSNVPRLIEWLKAGLLATPEGVTKPAVRELIASLLKTTSASIQAQKRQPLGSSLSSTNTSTSLISIESALSEWAESAHSELQEQLDLAFSGRRWRKLGWWKLFWRVDDVGMLTSDILAQRFLPNAERSSIFLAGRMKEAGVKLSPFSQASTPPNDMVTPSTLPVNPTSNSNNIKPLRRGHNWPTNIPNARGYLLTETVPALQALAQKLVLQTLSTSGLMTSLGALAYIGSLTTTLYEAGAIAALGIIWSMRRMQRRWETARDFWEGEVREEGRKAVRGVEETISSTLTESSARRQGRDTSDTQEDLNKAHNLVTRAEKLLAELR